MADLEGFNKELVGLVNKYNIDTFLNTPDYIIASLITFNISSLSVMLENRDKWHGVQYNFLGNIKQEGQNAKFWR